MNKTVAEFKDEKPKGPVKQGIADLLAKMEGQGKAKMFPVAVYGCYLQFRYPESIADMDEFKRMGLEFMIRLRTAVESKKGLPPVWWEALSGKETWEDADFAVAFSIHFWSHPDDKIDETQALRMVAANAMIASEINDQIDHQIHNGQNVLCFGGVMEAKKNSPTTTQNDSGSKRASRSTEKTQSA